MSGESLSRSLRRDIPAGMLPTGVVAVLGLLYALGQAVGWGSDSVANWVSSWTGTLAAAAAAVSLLYAAQRTLRPGQASPEKVSAGRISRNAWLWFGVAALCWCFGATINAVSRLVLSRAAAVSLADLFFLAAVVALTAGFVVPSRLPDNTREWLRYAGDTYVGACALFVVGWVAVFAKLYHLSGETPSEFFFELIYPIIDAVLVCAALPWVLGTAWRHRRSAAVAYAALLAIALADVATTAARLRGADVTSNSGDLLRFVGLLLLAVVPWMDRQPRSRTGAGDDDRGRLIGPGVVPAAAAGAAAIFVAGHSLTSTAPLEPVVPVVVGSAALVLLARLWELVRDNDRLRRSVDAEEIHFRALAESLSDVVLICNRDGAVQYVSSGSSQPYSYRPEDLIGRRVSEIVHPEDLPRVESTVAEFLEGDDDRVRVACRVRAADGTWLPTESTVCRYVSVDGLDSDTGSAVQLLVTTRDFSEQAALQRQVTHLTFHDGLTGLPNRAYLEERTREVIARQPDGRVAVVFVDLDGFTAVNDSIGHAGGDQLLAQAARRMRAAVQADDTVARWGGDEFAVLVESPAEAQAMVDLAERLLHVLSAEPYRVGDRSIVLTASIGVAFAEEEPADSDTAAAELIRNADVAMARAKELGGGRVEVFAAHMHADVVRRLELGSDLQRALAEEEFAVEFQPVVELATSRVSSVEALVRWWRGNALVPPEDFIGPAEESGLIVPLGNWVLRHACAEVARWRESDWDIGLSVNLSQRQITAPRFVESVAAALEESGLPPRALTLEVKEEVLVDDADETIERLCALRDLGVRLAIDDFGTGYASLAYLRQLPVDVIKIDPSFVAGLGRDDALTLLTRTIVQLGHDLGLVVVAEGIERPEQLELLREMGCPRGQGFLVARPMAPGRVESLIRTSLRGAAAIPLKDPTSAVSAG